MKDKLGGKIMTQFAVLRSNNHSYLTHHNHENKKSKNIKRCGIKQKCKFED